MDTFWLQEFHDFETTLKQETDFETFLNKTKLLSNRFALLEDGQNLNSSFSVILGLVEQYTHELLAKPDDAVRSRGIFTAKKVS